jgi:hypothetical protein
MPITLEITFAALTTTTEPVAVVLTGADMALGSIGKGLDKASKGRRFQRQSQGSD